MAGILYFLPGFPKPVAEPADLASYGDLAKVLDGEAWSQGRITGPDRAEGLLLAAHPIPGVVAPRLAYSAGEQVWHQVSPNSPLEPDTSGAGAPDLGGIKGGLAEQGNTPAPYWLGWWSATPPAPADLQRRQTLAGHRVVLGDGNEWLIPAIHAPRTEIPHVMRLGAERAWSYEPIDRYRPIIALGAKWYRVANGEAEPPSRSEWADFACQVLTLNYRLSRWEVSALGLLLASDSQYAALVAAALDFPSLAAEAETQKKTGDIPPGT